MPIAVRSVRVMIGRIPTRAAASIKGLLGKQNRFSTPSSRRMLAIASMVFICLISLSFGLPGPGECAMLKGQSGGTDLGDSEHYGVPNKTQRYHFSSSRALMNETFSPCPIFFAEHFLQNLAGATLGKAVSELDGLRHFEPSKVFSAMIHDFLFGSALRITQGDDRLRHFTPGIIRNRDHSAFEYRRMLVKHALDFRRGNVFASAQHHVLGAIDDQNITLVIDRGDVTRVKPLIADSLRGGAGIAPIASHNHVAAHNHS